MQAKYDTRHHVAPLGFLGDHQGAQRIVERCLAIELAEDVASAAHTRLPCQIAQRSASKGGSSETAATRSAAPARWAASASTARSSSALHV